MKNMKIEDLVKVSPRGQIVIPKEIRKKLGIVAGEKCW
jgi:AbrB family looped-hinge helix DNA binding protein